MHLDNIGKDAAPILIRVAIVRDLIRETRVIEAVPKLRKSDAVVFLLSYKKSHILGETKRRRRTETALAVAAYVP